MTKAGGVIAALLAGLLAAAIVVAPAFMSANPRLPVTATPGDVGLDFEVVTLSPPDAPITLGAWWIRVPDSKATLVANDPVPYVARVTRFLDATFAREPVRLSSGWRASQEAEP